MRYDAALVAPKCAEAVNRLPEKVLADLIHELGEEPRARRVARSLESVCR